MKKNTFLTGLFFAALFNLKISAAENHPTDLYPPLEQKLEKENPLLNPKLATVEDIYKEGSRRFSAQRSNTLFGLAHAHRCFNDYTKLREEGKKSGNMHTLIEKVLMLQEKYPNPSETLWENNWHLDYRLSDDLKTQELENLLVYFLYNLKSPDSKLYEHALLYYSFLIFMETNRQVDKEEAMTENPSLMQSYMNSLEELDNQREKRVTEFYLSLALEAVLLQKPLNIFQKNICLSLISSHLKIETSKDFIKVVKSIIKRQPEKFNEFDTIRRTIRAINKKKAEIAANNK